MRNPENHILNAHRKIVQRMLTQEREVRNIFYKFIRETSPLISQYRHSSGGVLFQNKAIDKKIEVRIEQLNRDLVTYIEKNQAWAWDIAEQSTDSMVRSYTRDMALSETVQKGLMARNTEALNAFLKTGGKSISDMVWKTGDDLREQLKFYTASGISQGRSAEKISQDIRQILNEPDRRFRRIRDPKTGKLKFSQPMKDYHPGRGVYRSSYKNALRLARTETNMAYHEATHQRWNNLDFVRGYEIKLSGSHPVYDICDELLGIYPKTFKFRGWHPQCLCHAVPVMMKENDFLDHITGEKVDMSPVRMPGKFKKWVSTHKEQVAGWKDQPYFIRDNFRYGNIKNGLKSTIEQN